MWLTLKVYVDIVMPIKSDFVRALRPFSLIVAIATCGLGVSQAFIEGYENNELIALVILTGVLLQVAVNLINDHRDLQDRELNVSKIQAIRRNTRYGWSVMSVAIILGIFMVSIRGWPLFVLGLVGVFGAWGYTGGSINYKNRGLGVALVFVLMGVLLVGGSYYVVSGTYHSTMLWLSIPFSLLSSLLLLSNELRDYEEDRTAGIKTLSVRQGYEFGVRLYYALVALLYIVSVVLFQAQILEGIGLLLLTILALWQPLKLLGAIHSQRARLTLLTGRFYFVYSLAFLTTIWLPVL